VGFNSRTFGLQNEAHLRFSDAGSPSNYSRSGEFYPEKGQAVAGRTDLDEFPFFKEPSLELNSYRLFNVRGPEASSSRWSRRSADDLELSSLQRPTEHIIERSTFVGTRREPGRQRPQTACVGKGCLALRRLSSRNLGEPVNNRPGSKISSTHAGLPAGGVSSSTWYPRLRSSRIILRARTFLAAVLTAGPRSS
jgi:hypothetical protein